jgi:hypothetical protein
MMDENLLDKGVKCVRIEDETFTGWQQYPENFVLEPAAVNTQFYRDRISSCRAKVFSELSSDVDLEIIDVWGRPCSSSSAIMQ